MIKYAAIISYILLTTANALVIKYLAHYGAPGSLILLMRGSFCLLFVLSFAVAKRQSLIPKKIKVQFFRFLSAGLGLLCVISSYKYLHASTVSLIQGFQLLIIVVVGGILSHRVFNLKIAYSLLVLLLGLTFLILFKNASESNVGIWLNLLGVCFIVCGYFLIKSIVELEHYLVIAMTSALGSVVMGGTFYLCNQDFSFTYNLPTIFLFLLLGSFMFAIYRLTAYIYSTHTVERSEYFTLIATILIMPLEYYFIGSSMDIAYVAGLIGFSILVSFAVFIPTKSIRTINTDMK